MIDRDPWVRETPSRTRKGEERWSVEFRPHVAEALGMPINKITGRPKTSARFDSFAEANEWARDKRRQWNAIDAAIIKESYRPLQTIGQLVEFARNRTEFSAGEGGDLSENSLRTYNSLLNRLSDLYLGPSKSRFYDRFFGQLTSEDVDDLYQYNIQSVSKHHANMCNKVLKRVFNIGIKYKKARHNPFVGKRTSSTPPRRMKWTDAQLMKFIETSDKMGLWSMGTLALMCHDLCQRVGDVRQMKWQNFDGEYFSFYQEKTRKHTEGKGLPPLEIICTQRLIERLRPVYRTVNDYSRTIVEQPRLHKPFDKDQVNKFKRQIFSKAELPPELWLNDLRRTGLTQAGQSGLSITQLQSLSGHKDPSMLEVYVLKDRSTTISAQQQRGL